MSIALTKDVADEQADHRTAVALRRSEAYLAEAQRLTRTGSWARSPVTDKLTYLSDGYFRVFGFNPHDGVQFTDFIQRLHPEDRDRIVGIIKQAQLEKKEYEISYRIVHPDGQVRHVESVGHPVLSPDGELLEIIGTVIDVTERKRAEEALRSSEERFRLIVNNIPGLLYTATSEGDIEFVNQQVLDYTGKTIEELKDWSACVHQDDLASVVSLWNRSVETGQPYDDELRILGADGAYRWFHVRALPHHDKDGRIVRWYTSLYDIDDRKKGEAALQRAFEENKELKDQLYRENIALRQEVDETSMFEEIVGSSDALRTVLNQVAKVAQSDSTVLILGETGTGKELIARAIHKRSNRASRAFVRVNCAAIPPSLIPSELFGHEKGAFTGALQRRLGRFELADGGTIFLDEVGELPLETQVSLLRVLQEREFERVGSSESITTSARVLAATNRDLSALVDAGKFRQDLFYRLNVFPIEMPALRERVDDIPLLVEYLIDRYAKAAGRTITHIPQKTLERFKCYRWPGNIRELQNVIQRAIVLCDGPTFCFDETWLKNEPAPDEPSASPERGLGRLDAKREKELIETALADCKGRIAGAKGAAARLGIPRTTLESKIRALEINKYRFKS